MLDGSELDGPPPLRRASTVDYSNHNQHPPHTLHGNVSSASGAKLMRRASLDDLEQETCQLTPKIDQRIIVINSDEVTKIVAVIFSLTKRLFCSRNDKNFYCKDSA